MTGTDHRAEALFEIDRARLGMPAEAGGPREMEALSLAQVHATLALADEQRTANLIALLAADAGRDDAPIRFMRDIGLPGICNDIATRLGLDS